MTALTQFDTVLVPFPFTDRRAQKRRPALVLSAHPLFYAATNQLLCAMITSAKHSRWPLDVTVTRPEPAGLPHACMIRMKLFTLDAGLVIRPLGRLDASDAEHVRRAFFQLVGAC